MLQVLDENMERIQAKRDLELHAVMSAAGGRLTKDATRGLLQDLEAKANAGIRRKPIKPTAEDLARLGIQVNPGKE